MHVVIACVGGLIAIALGELLGSPWWLSLAIGFLVASFAVKVAANFLWEASVKRKARAQALDRIKKERGG